jgi:hypothetical protein
VRYRRGGINIIGILMAMAVVAVFGGLVLFGPPQWDYILMKEITKNAAYEWKKTGSVESAKDRMIREMEKKHISMDIGDNDCKFWGGTDELTIDCEWLSIVKIPLSAKEVPREFKLKVYLKKNGEIEQW